MCSIEELVKPTERPGFGDFEETGPSFPNLTPTLHINEKAKKQKVSESKPANCLTEISSAAAAEAERAQTSVESNLKATEALSPEPLTNERCFTIACFD